MSSVLTSNIKDLRALLVQVQILDARVQLAAEALGNALVSGRKLLACGNGGSAADAAHLTTEFVCRFNKDRKPYPAIALTAHGGDLTAIGNDYDFHDLFARQVEAFGSPGDVLFAFTTSGRSENVRRALIAAEARQMRTIAFLGKDGGRCLGLADIDLLVESQTTARIQEMHKLLLHTVCEIVEPRLQQARCPQDRQRSEAEEPSVQRNQISQELKNKEGHRI